VARGEEARVEGSGMERKAAAKEVAARMEETVEVAKEVVARVGAARAAVAWAVARVETYSGRHSRSSPCPSRTAPARRTYL